jgi:hypothetical protein
MRARQSPPLHDAGGRCLGFSPMRGRIILILEGDLSAFSARLQEKIKEAGGESVLVRNPAALNGVRFNFSAAAINVQGRSPTH